MTTLELAQTRVYLRRVGSEHHGPCPQCGHGPNSTPQTSDRLSIKGDGERWFCRTCRPQGGNAVTWLMHFEGKNCPEAHIALGRGCDDPRCLARDKCRLTRDAAKAAPRAPRRLEPPAPAKADPEYVPAAAVAPIDLWRERAAKLIDEAHAALLACPEQLAYLAGRGLPLEAVVRYRLGWIEQTIYRARPSWGLAQVYKEGGKEKKLWIPRGLLLPTIIDGVPHRLRVRRPKNELPPGQDAYIEIPGSGNDRVLLNPEARAVVVVESDLDALLIDWLAGDLVGALPTVSASAKPKESAWPILKKALCILVALDSDDAGVRAAEWWIGNGRDKRPAFERAKRWPVPQGMGKDPGEYHSQHGGDIREWILAGLPPVFRLKTPAAAIPAAPKASPLPADPLGPKGEGGATAPGERAQVAKQPATAHTYYNGCERKRRPNGVMCLVAYDYRDLAAYAREFPDHAIFCIDEMKHLKGLSEEALDAIVAARIVLPGSEIVETRELTGEEAPKEESVPYWMRKKGAA